MATAAERMTRIWEAPPGFLTWFATVDHKSIGRRYIVTAFLFFGLGGLDALAMRAQLTVPNENLLPPNTYDQFFTMHGVTMIFLFAVPVLIGFGNYLVPLMIGAREVAFPRLNAFGYWVFLFAGIFLWFSLLIGKAPDAGWFNYVPLSNIQHSTGVNINFYSLGIIYLGISTVGAAINLIVTILKMRAPGMSINRMPLFAWGMLVTCIIIMFAFPSLTVTNILLLLDRQAGTHFFDPSAGGNALLWQHLFWFFGHPEVYIVFLPAAEIVSTIIPTFSRRPITAYILLVLALIATGFLSFGVWVHHMFATGLPTTSLSFFSAASMVISIPSGIQVFCWITTIWNGRIERKTPLLFAAGFIVVFVTGGISGVMFAVVPFDLAETGSYFVVAHLHFVIAASAIFPVFGGIYYWFPKMTGRMYHERSGIISFWLMEIGFILTFLPMHITGLEGMPRRVYTYPAGMGWEIPNIISTAGAAMLGFGIAVFLVNIFWSLRNGEAAGNNPWNAGTLEWLTTSPPPPYNFLEIPTVHGRDPLWGRDRAPGGEPEITYEPRIIAQLPLEREADQPGTPELDEIPHRETVATSMVDSELERLIPMPTESTWPFMLALSLLLVAIGFIGPIPLRIFVVIGIGGAIISIAGWLWPREARA